MGWGDAGAWDIVCVHSAWWRLAGALGDDAAFDSTPTCIGKLRVCVCVCGLPHYSCFALFPLAWTKQDVEFPRRYGQKICGCKCEMVLLGK